MSARRDPWADYQTDDPRPWVDVNGNRHSRRTKKFDTPEKYLAYGHRWAPRDAQTPERARASVARSGRNDP